MAGHENSVRGNKNHERHIFAGCAILAGAALRVVLWPGGTAGLRQWRAPFHTCHLTYLHPFWFSSQKPSVVSGIVIYRSFSIGTSFVSSFLPWSVVIWYVMYFYCCKTWLLCSHFPHCWQVGKWKSLEKMKLKKCFCAVWCYAWSFFLFLVESWKVALLFAGWRGSENWEGQG